MIAKLIEVLLTAEIFNRFGELKEEDIPKDLRKVFYENGGIKRPLVVRYDLLKKFGNVEELKRLPFVDFNNFNRQFRITSLELAAKWFVKNGLELIKRNPVLAYYFQNFDSVVLNLNNPLFVNATKLLSGKISNLFMFKLKY